MNRYTKENIFDVVEEEDVEFIRLQFADLFGTLKNIAVTTSQLEKILEHQCIFDGAAIDGFANHDMAELYLEPEVDSFVIFPWRPQQGKVGRFICNVLTEDGEPFAGDTRNVLKNVLSQAEELGYSVDIGAECEFFLFDTDEEGGSTTNTREKGSYFDIGPVDQGENARREMVLFLEEMGFEVESSFHAREAAQHIIRFKNAEALLTADNIITFKMVVRTVAKRHGFHATFMPKPKKDLEGSGMRLTFTLYKDGKNVFTDTARTDKFSKTAYQFMAGIMNHMEGMALINNPIVNSYKRFVSGFNAPGKVTCSTKDREAMLRLISFKNEGTRLELRSPDGASNPYLVFAVCLAAGLDGIKRELKAPALDSSMTETGKVFPNTLEDAIIAFEKDAFLQDVLGKHIVSGYLDAKKQEWNRYCEEVTQWEVRKYLNQI